VRDRARAAARYAEQHFSVSMFAERFDALLREVVAANGTTRRRRRRQL
jgi:hypothetical protein